VPLVFLSVYALLSIVVITAYGAILAIPARYVPELAAEGQATLGILFVLV
jgi:hypothetical protein